MHPWAALQVVMMAQLSYESGFLAWNPQQFQIHVSGEQIWPLSYRSKCKIAVNRWILGTNIAIKCYTHSSNEQY